MNITESMALKNDAIQLEYCLDCFRLKGKSSEDFNDKESFQFLRGERTPVESSFQKFVRSLFADASIDSDEEYEDALSDKIFLRSIEYNLMNSKTFEFLYDEEDLYTDDDLIEKW